MAVAMGIIVIVSLAIIAVKELAFETEVGFCRNICKFLNVTVLVLVALFIFLFILLIIEILNNK